MAKKRKQPRQSGGTPATVLLDKAGVAYSVRAYAHDPRATNYGTEAAQALAAEPGQVFKTLLIETDHGLGVAVVPVGALLDLKAAAAALGAKRATMADPHLAERTTGYVVGGISPLGQRKRLPTVVDVSAQGRPTILVSGGRRGLDLELAPDALLALLAASYADIARRS
ncbi:MAG: Cys-tRNA(Pro) deacylase [Ornithinimicrobium sp.]|uniref:Cys-tRNA(Pro) deacylase n=1 Tax=Ornithinimicrobium sp. TaxID=1977084 RepID=UPI0026DECAEC|nr:Cys-tRNA(Pro) deacylase [Ornithinimicrobium sp.]MDO5738560.1 Cys-tRNA(Pro) deacylase [Ornithinimicrobium sp.]